MKKIVPIIALILLAFSAGCASFFTNIQTPQQTLDLNESAIFSQEKTKFIATVNTIELNKKGSYPRQVAITMIVKNSGPDAFSLIGYPRLVDASGQEYPGVNMVFGGIQPGGTVTGKSSITIDSAEEYANLQKGAMLKVRFQSMKPLPYEGIWNVDFTTL